MYIIKVNFANITKKKLGYYMASKNKFFIDVTKEICPITFVKVKLMLENMPQNSLLEVKCFGNEPLVNIPQSAIKNGYTVVSTSEVANENNNIIIIKKN